MDTHTLLISDKRKEQKKTRYMCRVDHGWFPLTMISFWLLLVVLILFPFSLILYAFNIFHAKLQLRSVQIWNTIKLCILFLPFVVLLLSNILTEKKKKKLYMLIKDEPNEEMTFAVPYRDKVFFVIKTIVKSKSVIPTTSPKIINKIDQS